MKARMNTDSHEIFSAANDELRITGYKFSSSPARFRLALIFLLLSLSCASLTASAQSKIAVLVPEKTFQSQTLAGKLEKSLAGNFRVLDDSLSEAAYRATSSEKPFNLSLAEAKNIGAAIGCDYFTLVRAATVRRYSFEKKEFYESYAAVYVVSARTGRLIFWKLTNGEAETAEKAERKLFDSERNLAAEIFARLKIAREAESNEKSPAKLEELPAENSPAARNFRPPLPYRRIRPEYTPIADLYGVEATIDAEIDVDENGKILKIEIARWAGFGLDESVAAAVYKMQWRPASRDEKTLPIRVLLRYNFKKIEEEK